MSAIVVLWDYRDLSADRWELVDHFRDCRLRFVFWYVGLFCIFPDTTCKALSFCLPEIKIFMTLVVTVHDSGLARQEYLADKGTFISFAIGEKYFWWDRLVDVKAKMHLGFLAVITIIGPVHGKNRINQWAVNGYEISKFCVFPGQDFSCFCLQLLKNVG